MTYPDAIDTVPVSPTFGKIAVAKDNSPACLDGTGGGARVSTRRSSGS